jgi:hypothetical protein
VSFTRDFASNMKRDDIEARAGCVSRCMLAIAFELGVTVGLSMAIPTTIDAVLQSPADLEPDWRSVSP